MLADRLTVGNFCSRHEQACAAESINTFPGWLYYHFGGRTEEEMDVLFSHALRACGLEEDGRSYLDLFSSVGPEVLFIGWQEVVAHA